MYVPDPEHFFPAADPGERDRLPEPVRQRESHGRCGAGDPGDAGEHAGGDRILQVYGQKAENMKTFRWRSIIIMFRKLIM